MKMTYQLDVVTNINETGEAHLLDVYNRIKSGLIDQDDAPEGFLAAITKLPNDASDDFIMRTIIGEVTALMLADALPVLYPGEKLGVTCRVHRVAYAEIAAKLPPPVDAVPLLVVPGNKTLN